MNLEKALVWFRRDLRDHDHAALAAALSQARQVYCAFVFDRDILDPLVSTVDHIQRMIRAADLNRVGKTLVEAAAKNPDAAVGLVERVTPQRDPAATKEGDAVQNLDAHFWTNKRAVLLLLMLANLFMGIATIVFDTPKGGLALTLAAYATILVYPILVLPAALTRRAWLFALTMGLHIALYLCLAGLSLMHPELTPATAAGAA